MAECLVVSDPRVVSVDRYLSLFAEYLQTNELEQITLQVRKTLSCPSNVGRNNEHISIQVVSSDLIHFDSSLAFQVIHNSKLLIPLFEQAAKQVFSTVLQVLSPSSASIITHNKMEIHIRILHLPPIDELSKKTISDIRAGDVSSLVQITGTIVRTGGVRMLEQSKEYECLNTKCRARFTVTADIEQDNMLPHPRVCIAGTAANNCKSSNLMEVEGSAVCVDYQEIKLQDHVERLTLGSVPRSIVVILKADLVDKFNAGDNVIVVGLLVRQWRALQRGVRCNVEMVIEANSVTSIHSQENSKALTVASSSHFSSFWEFERAKIRALAAASSDSVDIVEEIKESHMDIALLNARNKVVRAVCPHLYGMFYVKLCLLLTLIGGTTSVSNSSSANSDGTRNGTEVNSANGHDENNAAANVNGNGSQTISQQNLDPQENRHSNDRDMHGMHRRSQSHLLIVGDPGCGKSQLLRFASAVSARSVLTTGMGTTGAGLTCTAIRDGGEWTLEAGALVLSNGGVCCIDEFSSIKEHDRATIHEAMEQQTLSIAKAGLVVKLNTRCSVIACCNPKGAFDSMADLTVNTAIAAPLLSRFDLIIVLADTPDKDWDKQVSTFLLQQAMSSHSVRAKEHKERPKDREGSGGAGTRGCGSSGAGKQENIWDLSTLKQYIAYVRSCVQPVISPEARLLLTRYYQLQRQSDERSSARTTIRLLQSLMRLSEAHAKLMMRERVGVVDAVVAIQCMLVTQGSATQSSLLAPQESIKDGFPSDPYAHYINQEEFVLSLLHINKQHLQDAQHEGKDSDGDKRNRKIPNTFTTVSRDEQLRPSPFHAQVWPLNGLGLSQRSHASSTTALAGPGPGPEGSSSSSISAQDRGRSESGLDQTQTRHNMQDRTPYGKRHNEQSPDIYKEHLGGIRGNCDFSDGKYRQQVMKEAAAGVGTEEAEEELDRVLQYTAPDRDRDRDRESDDYEPVSYSSFHDSDAINAAPPPTKVSPLKRARDLVGHSPASVTVSRPRTQPHGTGTMPGTEAGVGPQDLQGGRRVSDSIPGDSYSAPSQTGLRTHAHMQADIYAGTGRYTRTDESSMLGSESYHNYESPLNSENVQSKVHLQVPVIDGRQRSDQRPSAQQISSQAMAFMGVASTIQSSLVCDEEDW